MAKNKTKQKAWTIADDEFLKANYKKLSALEIAAQMNRSRSSINSRVFTLKLKDSKKDQEQKAAPEPEQFESILTKLKSNQDKKNKEVETIKEKILIIEKALDIVKEESLV